MNIAKRKTAAIDAERALIGTVLLKPTTIDECGDLTGFDFADQDLGRTWDALRLLQDAGKLAMSDPGKTLLAMRYAGGPDTVANPSEVRLLMEMAGKGDLGLFHAGMVRHSSSVRRQRAIAQEWLRSLNDSQNDPTVIAERVHAEVSALGSRQAIPVRDFAAVASEFVTDLRRRQANPSVIVGVASGLHSVDAAVGNWHGGELVVLAARPGMGKSALAMQSALHNGKQRRRVLFVSLEMRDRELVARVLCGESGVDGRRLRSGSFVAEDVHDLDVRRLQLGEIPITVFDPPAATVEGVRSVARLEHARRPLSLIVVDYLQLLRSTDSRRQRHEQVGEQTASLKSLAKELDCPVLCLAQLNRQADSDEPRLSHLRESGSIEQDADIVLALSRSGDHDATLHVLKHRHGDIGELSLKWNGPATRFEEPSPKPVAG